MLLEIVSLICFIGYSRSCLGKKFLCIRENPLFTLLPTSDVNASVPTGREYPGERTKGGQRNGHLWPERPGTEDL